MINAGICTPLEMHVALHDAKFDQNIQNVELVCRHAGRVRCLFCITADDAFSVA